MKKRDEAFSIEIRDPDSIDKSPIVKTENINDSLLLILKEKSIYKLITADSTDPERTYPDTGHTYEKTSNLGASSPYVARIFIQFKGIIDQTFQEGSLKKKIIQEIWNLNEQLLSCAQFELNITDQLSDIITKCDALIESNKNTLNIPPLPKFKNLENDAKSFLLAGKQFLIDCFKTISTLTDVPISPREEAHFEKHIKWLDQNRPSLHELVLALNNDLPWIRRLSECRNAIEHPGPGQLLSIQNTKLHPGNKFSLPTWSYDLTKKLNLQELSVPIHLEMEIYLNNMLHFLEEILLFCISDKISSNKIFSIYQYDENSINQACPVRYYAGVSAEFHSKIKKP